MSALARERLTNTRIASTLHFTSLHFEGPPTPDPCERDCATAKQKCYSRCRWKVRAHALWPRRGLARARVYAQPRTPAVMTNTGGRSG